MTPVAELDFDHTLVVSGAPMSLGDGIRGQDCCGAYWHGVVTFSTPEDAIVEIDLCDSECQYQVGQKIRMVN